MEPRPNDGKAESVSYRHLFTITDGNSDWPCSTGRALDNSRQFTFQDSGVGVFKASKNINEGSVEQLKDQEGDHHMSDVSQIPIDVSTGAEHAEGQNDQDGMKVRTNEFDVPTNKERIWDGHHALEPEYGQPPEENPAFQLPDDIFSRPETLIEIASQFVRGSTIGELEEDWERVDGARDQMRRDFKIRRQKATGSVKLGGSKTDFV